MMNSSTARRNWIFVLVLTAMYLALALCWQDISYFDETFYMDSGTRFRFSTLVQQLQFAPLYALWYRLLEFVCPWPVWRYFLSWGALVSLALLLPLAMRLRSACLYAWLLVCVPFFGISNLATTPYVMLFTACFLLAGACLVRIRNLTMAETAFLAFLACFIASFARPEFAFFVPLLGIVSLLALRTSSSSQSKPHARLQIYIVVALSLLMLLILRHGGGSRSGIAFAQHFNQRAAERHLIPPQQNHWNSDYALRVFHLDPGNTAASTTATIFQFMKANPRLFAAHMLANLMTTMTWVSCLVLLLLLSVPFWPTDSLGEQTQRFRPMAFYIFLVSLPSFTSILFVFPDQHYFFTLLPVVLVYATELLATGWTNPLTNRRGQLWLLIAAPPIIFLSAVGMTPLKAHRFTRQHPVRDTVACLQDLQQLPTASNGPIYESVGVAPVLLGAPRAHVELWDIVGWRSFQGWVQDNHPAWVEVTPTVARSYGVSSTEMDAYLRGLGYISHPCPSLPDFAPLQVYIAGQQPVSPASSQPPVRRLSP